MFDRVEVRPGDRVLLVTIPRHEEVSSIARRLITGAVVGLGNDQEVAAARNALREHDNAMFVRAAPSDIPWRDHFFTRAIDAGCDWADADLVARELARVLAPGSMAYFRSDGVCRPLEAAGFTVISRDPSLLVMKSAG